MTTSKQEHPRRTRRTPLTALGGVVFAATAILGTAVGPAAADSVSQDITVYATTEGFVDSGIVLPDNTEVTLTASGSATFAQNDPNLTAGPDGFAGACIGGCPIDGANLGALIVKIGDAAPVIAGSGPTTLTGSGPVSFAFNDTSGNSNDNGGSFLVTAQYDNGLTAPTLTGTPPAGTVGQPYHYAFTVAGQPGPAVTATATLPAGLTLSEAGVLAGTPTAAGSFTFAVTATNTAGSSDPLPVTIEVTAPSTGFLGSLEQFFGFGS